MDEWMVHGELGLHGSIRPLTMNVTRKGGRDKGSATVNQSEYAIVPVSIAGGVVTIRYEIEVDFDTSGSVAATPQP